MHFIHHQGHQGCRLAETLFQYITDYNVLFRKYYKYSASLDKFAFAVTCKVTNIIDKFKVKSVVEIGKIH